MYNTTTPKNQRTPLVTSPAPHLWSTAEGNYHAPWRDVFRDQRDQHVSIKAYIPPPDVNTRDLDEHVGSVIAYVPPGKRLGTKAKQLFWKLVNHPTSYPKRAEIEFSSPPGCEPSLPRAYKNSAIDWTLSICSEVLICVDHSPGSAEGEAHRVLAPLQVVFRCRENEIPAWTEYLEPRLHGRHRLSVVHIAAGRA